MIVLFDIDGTLTTGSSCGRGSLEQAFFDELAIADALRGISLHGNIDWRVVEDVAQQAGRWPGEHEARRALVTRVLSRYAAVFADRVGSMPYRSLPGARECVLDARDAGDLVGLATGNMAASAHGKLASAGLGDLFEACVGGYGDEAETRAGVVALAIERAYAQTANRGPVWLVGDTPLDVAAGHTAGAFVAGVATGAHDFEALQACGADLVFADLFALIRSPPWR